ncbi:hypothetical protein [Halorussus halophilus]|uniref:hypothetical protein n=1 Tax=Halorussus halophilus TaxID=2650975 RepID=UPI0013014652|nr:hypothetical protein [Halorussus halophilus]
MDQSVRLVLVLAIALSPMVLYVGLLRGLARLCDGDASDRFGGRKSPSGVTDAAAEMLDTGPIRSGNRTLRSESVACSDCGTSNVSDAAYCRSCLRTLRE